MNCCKRKGDALERGNYIEDSWERITEKLIGQQIDIDKMQFDLGRDVELQRPFYFEAVTGKIFS